MKVGFISLGCSKNLIDTEILIGKFEKNKHKIVNNPEEAEIIVINTCGFIESAKEEAINTILEMAEYKNKNCKYLIVIGCLVQRYYKELKKAIPEIDLLIKIEDYDKIWEKIENLDKKEHKPSENKDKKIKQMPMFKKEDFLQRKISTGENYAYLKIGEGCSNMCTYCAIPYIRGLFKSRPIEDIIEEAKKLAKTGIKEIIIIAQDTTKYGMDIYGKPKLAELLQKLCEIKEIKWIRFLYSYPEGITDELIETVKNEEKICKYFDIPIQHISNNILKKMNRKTSKQNIENIIEKIKSKIPNVILRTTLIVGFPGETQKDFEELYEFVKKMKFDKLGVFKYSKEEGTPAATMPNQIHHMTKTARYNKIMKLQKQISKENISKNIGKQYEALIEGQTPDKKYLIGRTKLDVPEIDGVVYIKNNNKNLINKFVKCKIIEVENYDMIAEIVN